MPHRGVEGRRYRFHRYRLADGETVSPGAGPTDSLPVTAPECALSEGLTLLRKVVPLLATQRS